MERIAMGVKIRQKFIPQYKRFHKHVWPEVETMMRKLGFRNVSIFLCGDTLFLYQEYFGSQPIEEAYAEYARNETCQRWEKAMSKIQLQSSGTLRGVNWMRLEELYHFEK